MKLTYRLREAKAFPNRVDAWVAANAYVAANPTHSADVELHPALRAIHVVVWRPGPGWGGWLA